MTLTKQEIQAALNAKAPHSGDWGAYTRKGETIL